ncbi:biotin synthase BioB [Trichococcus collinsii]|uniref:Biotin synthase n=1 Tax=Trichococcus collinsii TaxID=157076 RepID=A0AB38A0N5_9LACT|nr:biotin synthase BioB [Trichococcus collinsii]CZQ90638.1 radical sam [Trichococcus collinsii]SEA52356.1 biotin synthase [Trichococcus collinsii]
MSEKEPTLSLNNEEPVSNNLATMAAIKSKLYAGGQLTKEEAMALIRVPLEELCATANEVREHFCGNVFDVCTIINGKSGKCSENCKFCSQSRYYRTKVDAYSLIGSETIVEQAKYNEERGVLRYSIVTSGRALSSKEVDNVCESLQAVQKESDIALCGSFGLLEEKEFAKLKQAGLTRVHNNLETSRRNFPNVCTTHTYDDKIAAIRAAQQAGLTVCSGGIIGLGETMEDRIDMVIDLREMGIRSIPVNLLNPIPGTPFEGNEVINDEEMSRIIAIFRLLAPDAYIRLAGGRGLLADKGRQCFLSGANAAISGDMLTTDGITIEQDMRMLGEIGYEVVLCDD